MHETLNHFHGPSPGSPLVNKEIMAVLHQQHPCLPSMNIQGGEVFIDICVLSGLVHLNIQCVEFSFRLEIMTLSVQNQVLFGI